MSPLRWMHSTSHHSTVIVVGVQSIILTEVGGAVGATWRRVISHYICTTEAIEIKGTAPSVCTLRKLIMVYEYACHGVWSYTTREGVWLSQQIHC